MARPAPHRKVSVSACRCRYTCHPLRQSFERSIVTLVDQAPPLTSAPAHRVNGWAIPAGYVWAICVALWLFVDNLMPVSTAVQIVCLAVILAALGLIGAAAMSGDLTVSTALARLRLGPWMAIGFALVFGLATLMWLTDFIGYHGLVTRASLMPAGVVSGVGFLALVVAYRSTPRQIRAWGNGIDRRLRGDATFSAGPMSVWSLWGVAFVAQAIGFARGSLGYLSDPVSALSTTSSADAILSILTELGTLATVVAAWRFAVTKRPAAMVLLAWVAASQLAVGLFAGGKQAAIVQLIAIVVGYSARSKIRWRLVATAGLIVLFIIGPFVTAYRTTVVTGSGRLSPAEALQSVDFYQLATVSLTGGSNGGTLVTSLDRWSRIGDLAIIVEKTPHPIGYLSPIELLGGPFLGFIPRSIWPSKPILDAGYQINQQYYESPADVYSSAAATPYGDLYRHGGMGVVVIGMAALGMFVRTVDDRRGGASNVEPRLLFLPMLLFPELVKQEVDYMGLCASLVSIILAAALGARMVSRRTSTPS